MDTLTLKQLRYFSAVAAAEHFGRAADACSVSQPALSVQVKELETTLGLPVFERGARHVRLTAFGEDLLRRVQPILQSVDELHDLARAAHDGLSGRLRLGVIPTIAPYLLPTLLPHLTKAAPDMDIHVRETVTPRLIKELTDGALDAAIVALPIDEPTLTEMPLFDEDLVLVRPATDPETKAPRPEDLARMRLLMLEEGHCFRDQTLSFCAMTSRRPREGLDGSSLSTLVQMVGAGIGVTLIPDMAVAVEARAAPVNIIRFAAPRPMRTVGMIWRKTNPMADQLRDVAEIVRTAAPSMTD